MSVTIDHKLPTELGKQQFHVTLKSAEGKRIERKIESVSGHGKLVVKFDLPADYNGDSIHVSALVGEDYSSNLLHKTAIATRK